MKKFTLFLIATLFSALSFAELNPFAYGLTSELNADQTVLTVNYSLNATATSVDFVLLDGETIIKTVNLNNNGLSKGSYTATITLDDPNMPLGKDLTWKIEVKGAEVTNYAMHDVKYNAYHPSSVDIDNNPASVHFGRILCNESMQKVKGLTKASGDATNGKNYLGTANGAGIFEFNPAFEYVGGYNGGKTFPINRYGVTGTASANQAYVPRRIRISDDGRIFVTSLNSEGDVLWELNPDNLNEWTTVIADGTRSTTYTETRNIVDGSGNFIAGPNVGFDVHGSGKDLKLVMLSSADEGWGFNQSAFKCVEYNLGTQKTWNKPPSKTIFTKLALYPLQAQVQYDKDGGVWFTQYNSETNNSSKPGLAHWNVNNTNQKPDYIVERNNTRNAGFRYNNDYSKVIIANNSGNASVYDVTIDQNGIPQLSNEVAVNMTAMGGNLNDFAWDYADNIYVVSNSKEFVAVYPSPHSADKVVATPCASKYAFALPAPPQLNPFAYKLSSELSADEKNLTIKYSLNALATSVNWVLMDGETPIKTVDLSSLGLEKGDYTTTISTTDFPQYKQLKWKIEVKGVAVNEPTEYPVNHSIYHPSSVDIDNNPENETFGLLLVNEGMHAVKTKTTHADGSTYISSGFGAGIFAFNPAFENIGKYNGGITFTNTRADGTGTAYSPRRIRISDDGRIFVTSLNTDGNYLWEVNPKNMNEWTTVFKSASINTDKELVDASDSFIVGPNTGFDVKGSGSNLKLMMYSVNLRGITAAHADAFKCAEYNLGNEAEWSTKPSKTWIEGKYAITYNGTQVEYDNEGGFWVASYRGTATNTNPGLVHINKDGVATTFVWNNVRNAGIRFNHDYTKLVVAGYNGAAKKATIYTVSKNASGTPVLTEELVIDMAIVGNNLNDFAWDYAGNLYACGNSNEKLAVWVMPHSSDDVVATPAASKYTFSIGKYTMIANTNDENKGTVTGAGEYKVGETATLTATAKEGYKLLYWSDRSTENPRTITMNKNEAISAYFVKDYDEEQTFTITKVWENLDAPASTDNGYQAVGWDGKIYLKDRGNDVINVYSDATTSATYASTDSKDDQSIAVDDAGNLVLRSGSTNFYDAPKQVILYKKGETTYKTIDFTLPASGRCDFISASGDLFSAEGGYVYFYCQNQTTVSRLYVKNGGATAGDIVVDAVGVGITEGNSQSHVMVDIFGNLVTHSRTTAINKTINAYTGEATTFTLPNDQKPIALGGCSFELGGKEFWAYNVKGSNICNTEWNLYNMTDKKCLSDETLYLENKTDKNSAANWLNVQVIDENTVYIYQFCPKVAMAVWKVSRDIKYNVSATAENGTVTGAGKYKEGTTATLTATPDARYDFVNWTKGGVEVSTDATYSFEVTEDVELVANFSKKPDIAYELNGGQWNKYGWTSKKDMYDELLNDWRAYSGSSRTNVSYETQFGIGNSSKGIPTTIASTEDRVAFWNLFTDATYAPKWGWLATYVDAVAATQYKKMDVAQGIKTQPTSAAGVFTFTIGNFFGEDNAHAVDYIDAVDFTGAEAHPDAFQPTWGHLLSNPTQPTTTIELGNPYREGHDFGGWYETADFTGAAVTTIDENTVGTFYAKWNLVIDENADNNSTVLAPYEGESVTVTVKRNFEPNKCYTLTLPFDMNASQIDDVFGNATVYEFYNIVEQNAEELYLEFIPTSSIQAGEPCLVVTPSGSFDANDGFMIEDVIISTTPQPVQVGAVTMMPVLDNGYLMDDPSEYYVWDGGLYCAGTYNMTSKGLRAYFVSSSPLPVRARVVLKDNEATSIPLVGVDSSTQVRKIMKDGQIIIIRGEEQYNLQGQRID